MGLMMTGGEWGIGSDIFVMIRIRVLLVLGLLTGV